MLEEIELKKNLDKGKGELEQEVIEGLLRLQQTEEADKSLAIILYQFQLHPKTHETKSKSPEPEQTIPTATADQPENEVDNRQLVLDIYDAKSIK